MILVPSLGVRFMATQPFLATFTTRPGSPIKWPLSQLLIAMWSLIIMWLISIVASQFAIFLLGRVDKKSWLFLSDYTKFNAIESHSSLV